MTGDRLGGRPFSSCRRTQEPVRKQRQAEHQTQQNGRPHCELVLTFDIVCLSSSDIVLILLMRSYLLRQILVTGGAECQVVGLVLYQQIGLRRSMRLVARQAVDLAPAPW